LITSWQASLTDSRLERRLWKIAELQVRTDPQNSNQKDQP
jgi:hypothetical protein